MKLLLLATTLFGHVAIWVIFFNRLHAVALPRPLIKASEKVIALLVLVIGAAIVTGWPASGIGGGLLFGYEALCWLTTAWLIPSWLWVRSRQRNDLLLANDTRPIDVVAQLGRPPVGNFATRLAARFPGNQLYDLHVHEKRLLVRSLPVELNGLSIAHLSDLHFTGYVTRDYFDCVIEETDRLDADLVAITGDLLDKERCLEWIPETFGRLRSRFGVYFVLGNHDKRLRDVPDLRRRLVAAGLVDLGGQSRVITVRDRRLLLAGNERPWFRPLPDLSPPAEYAFRILLSHSPDQLPWAKAHGFDLMLAGHTHGGQIRFPWIGPVVTASRFGVRYAGGLFHEPPTVLHVSRGLSGVQTIRLNCPPELAKLVLQAGT